LTIGSAPVYVELQPGVPITCPPKKKAPPKAKPAANQQRNTNNNKPKEKEPEPEEEECCVNFDIFTRVSSTNTPRCASGSPFDLAVMNACTYRICADDWNATHRIPIWAVNDGLYGGDFDKDETYGSVVVDITTSEEKIPPRWQHIVLPPQEIFIHQAQIREHCIIHEEIKTFDGVTYENQLEGVFVAYKHSKLPFEVQILRKKCSQGVICNCAVAIRAGDIMFAFDVCSTGKMQIWSYTIDGSYIEPENLLYLPLITRLDEGRSYQIQLTSGTRLSLGHNLRFVKILASNQDYLSTSGLCGSLDRDKSNDFSSFVGQVVCPVTSGSNSCEDFAKSWRLLSDQSLFLGSFSTNELYHNDGRGVGNSDTNLAEGLGHCSCSSLPKPEAILLRPKSTTSGYATGAYASPYDVYTPPEENQDEDAEGAKCHSSRCVEPGGHDITHQLLDLVTDEDFIFDGDEFSVTSSADILSPVFYTTSKLPVDLLANTTEIDADAAETFCRGIIEGMPATKLCREIAHIDVEGHIKGCKNEILVITNFH